SRTDRQQSKFGAGLKDGLTHTSMVFVWSIDFQTWGTCHAVTQGADGQTINIHVDIRKNLSFSTSDPLSLLMTSQAAGPWIWKRNSSPVTAAPYGHEGERRSTRR